MTFPDLAGIAAEMAKAKVQRLEAAGVVIVLHGSAFAPALSGQAQDVNAFATPPSDEELQFWSVEGEREKPEVAP